ncbi:GntR family transcriptional regulator [Qaidamihabitans albus]|uniref:GntR family transcriptional regulator n=1 Tax=Qaidamihabitans albus TaxID=2795733 RepID=UPI0018F190DB|nr:GntR family transcriptional regulator [Qaidamihabitans albus]
MSDHTAAMPHRPRRHVLADEVYETVKTLVMDHVVRPGARISIDGLARELDVSPTPVREALARLESEGLASKEPLRGYRATPLLSRRELDELYEFRQLIEPWAARRAAEKIDRHTAAELRAEMASAVAPKGTDYRDYRALAAHDARFHSLLARLSGNDQVRIAFERTHCHLHIFRLYFASDIGFEAVTEHRTIAEAIIRGAPDAAEEAMSTHLDNSRTQRLHTVYRDSS